MVGSSGDVDRGAGFDGDVLAVEGDECGSRHDGPVFGPSMMQLVGESLARFHDDALDLAGWGVVEDDEPPPGAGLTVDISAVIGLGHGVSMAENRRGGGETTCLWEIFGDPYGGPRVGDPTPCG